MVERRNKLLDVISQWVEEREGAYLAKENKVVYFDSPTGRKQDAVWISLSLAEMVRTIRATRLTADSYRITTDICIEVFQELDRVYEYGVRSNVKTASYIFNYSAEAGYDLTEQAVELLAQTLHQNGLLALYVSEVVDTYNRILEALKLPRVGDVKRGELFRKHFTNVGYSYRVGEFRVMKDGKKTRALIYHGKKPADITTMASYRIMIANKVVGELR